MRNVFKEHMKQIHSTDISNTDCTLLKAYTKLKNIIDSFNQMNVPKTLNKLSQNK